MAWQDGRLACVERGMVLLNRLEDLHALACVVKQQNSVAHRLWIAARVDEARQADGLSAQIRQGMARPLLSRDVRGLHGHTTEEVEECIALVRCSMRRLRSKDAREARNVVRVDEDEIQGLDDLDMELLVEDARAALELPLDGGPFELRIALVAHLRAAATGGEGEECAEEVPDRVLREQLVELLLVSIARESDRHEGKLKHRVTLLVRAARLLDLGQRGLKDASLAASAEVRHLVGEEAKHRRQIDHRVVAEALQEVEEDLLVAGPLRQYASRHFMILRWSLFRSRKPSPLIPRACDAWSILPSATLTQR